ncbi:MAG: TolC family protein [Sphingomonas sp.]
MTSLAFVLGAGAAGAPAKAQSKTSGPGSLLADPQRGAAPAPLQTKVPPPATPVFTTPAPASAPAPRPLIVDPVPLQPISGRPAVAVESGADTVLRRTTQPGGLPAPTGDPMAIDAANDPLLSLFEDTAPRASFVSTIRSAIERSPVRDEAEAQKDVAAASRSEARAGLFPVVDLSATYFRVLTRAFSNDPNNVLERSRPSRRTDEVLRIQQSLFDFGSTNARIQAGSKRVDASIAGIDDASGQLALRTVAAWNEVFGYRTLVTLGDRFGETLTELRGQLAERIKQGVSAEGDLAQVDSYIAASDAQLAQFRRSLASAEAQFAQLTGLPVPPSLGRAPEPVAAPMSLERAQAEADNIPSVVSAKRLAEAAGYDTKAVKADALPGVSVGVDAGRYGVIENARDYDVRGTVTLSQRLFGGATQRIDGARARARGADAAYRRVRADATRDAAIAWSDVNALEEARAAIEANYIATRKSRDVLAERFRVSRGTLFDLLGTENNYYNVAVRYIQTVIELDTARYVLMARTGKLLDVLEIPSAQRNRK